MHTNLQIIGELAEKHALGYSEPQLVREALKHTDLERIARAFVKAALSRHTNVFERPEHSERAA